MNFLYWAECLQINILNTAWIVKYPSCQQGQTEHSNYFPVLPKSPKVPCFLAVHFVPSSGLILMKNLAGLMEEGHMGFILKCIYMHHSTEKVKEINF